MTRTPDQGNDCFQPFLGRGFHPLFWCLLLGGCGGALSGCQSMNRWRGESAMVDPSSEDDWAPPRTTPYSQPKQYVRRDKPSAAENGVTIPPAAGPASPAPPPTTAQGTPPSPVPPSGTAAKASLTETPAANPAAPAEARVAQGTPKSAEKHEVAKARLSDQPSPPNAPASMESTGDDEVDVEGALAALPPNLQEIARRQLAAIQSRQEEKSQTSTSKIAVSLSDRKPDEDESQAVAGEAVRLASHASAGDEPVATAVARDDEGERSPVVPATATTTPTSPSVATLPWNGLVKEAISKLEREIEGTSSHDENLRLSHEISLRLLYLADRQLDSAVRPIEGLEPDEQNYFLHQAQALYEAGNPDAMPVRSRRWSLVMNSQRQATHHLAAASNLEVRSLAFCTDVQGYGVMTKFPKYLFKPDQEILLYCELENVQAEELKTGFETQLQGTYEILDPNGRRVADQILPMEREICQNHRRDYFIIYHIFMPVQITPGNYQMRVTIEDMKARKFGQASLDFQIQK